MGLGTRLDYTCISITIIPILSEMCWWRSRLILCALELEVAGSNPDAGEKKKKKKKSARLGKVMQ